MKFVKVGLMSLAFATSMGAASAFSTPALAFSGPEWVCYYDRVTFKLLYCQWETNDETVS